MIHRLFVPKQAVGLSLIYFDLWVPSTSPRKFELLSLQPIVSGEVAVTGVVAVDLFLQRTTAVGTTGTQATYDGTSLTAMTFTGHDNSNPLTVQDVTARLTPGGGATGGAVLSTRSVYTEEASPGAYAWQPDMARNLFSDIPPVAIFPGSGIRVIQGGVASVGNIGFDVILNSVARN